MSGMRHRDTSRGDSRLSLSSQEASLRTVSHHLGSGSVRRIVLSRCLRLLPADPDILLRKGPFETDHVRPHRGILRSGDRTDRCVDLQVLWIVLDDDFSTSISK